MISNLFNKLYRRIKEIKNRNRIYNSLNELTESMGQNMLNQLRTNAPSGENWDENRFGPPNLSRESRPSIRQHGTTLEDAWSYTVRKGDGYNYNVEVSNYAPHLKFIVQDTRPHDVEGYGVYGISGYEGGRLAFFAGMKAFDEGGLPGEFAGDEVVQFIKTREIDHPGSEAQTRWIELSDKYTENEFKNDFIRACRNITFEPFDDWGGL